MTTLSGSASAPWSYVKLDGSGWRRSAGRGRVATCHWSIGTSVPHSSMITMTLWKSKRLLFVELLHLSSRIGRRLRTDIITSRYGRSKGVAAEVDDLDSDVPDSLAYRDHVWEILQFHLCQRRSRSLNGCIPVRGFFIPSTRKWPLQIENASG